MSGSAHVLPNAAAAGDWVNAKRRGAVGDGTADDTAVLQALLTAGGNIYLPAGTYKITSSLTMDSDVTLRGAGRGVSIIKAAMGSALLKSSNTATRFYRWGIHDLGFDNTNRATAGGIGIDLSNISHARLDTVTITNVATGIKLDNAAYYNELSTVEVSGATTGVSIGGGATSCNECLFNNLRINDVTNGVILNNSTNMTFVKPAVETFTGIGFDIAPTTTCQYTNLFGARFENAPTAGTGLRNRANAQATTVVGGMTTGLSTTYQNDANLDQLNLMVPGISMPRIKVDQVHFQQADNNTDRATVYASGSIIYFRNAADSGYVAVDLGSITVRSTLEHLGASAGFYGTTPIAKPAPTGSRGGNAALASLLTALANLGLITDSTSA